ncbi:hypothetical protein [Bifidobacterium commune]|nr:hypothetical protein [Bifidobacterium commune]
MPQGETIYKPVLTKMLAYNRHIDIANDEIRMDFVLRVAHGQVDVSAPQFCAKNVSASGRSCGLQLKYSYYGNSGLPTSLGYVNTKTSTNGKPDGTGAVAWSKNRDNKYTIQSVDESGEYDYLTISIEADISYAFLPNDQNALGGVPTQQYVYAIVGNETNNGFTSDLNDTAHVTNVAADYPIQLYSNCAGNYSCNGPRSFVGWDGYPSLVGGGQANWGMSTNTSRRLLGPRPIEEGIAPPKSFFTSWYHPSSSSSCSQVTSYYFQWLGLKDGVWVPVNDLTPQAQQVQQSPMSAVAAGTVQSQAAFNDVAPANASKRTLIAKQGSSGGLSPAQAADGSINFKKAKEDQGLDGYFKLVTWPQTTNADGSQDGCSTSENKDIYNPLSDHPNGVQQDMSVEAADALIKNGWTIDTAYYKYSVSLHAPAIDTPADNVHVSKHPVLSGTGTPGAEVKLYAEVAGQPIDPADPNSSTTAGRLVGSVVVSPDGRWSIQDNDNQLTSGTQRYHAIQCKDGIDSSFSNILAVVFGPSPAPTVAASSISIPHTKREYGGELAPASKVKVTGTAAPVKAGDKLEVYATHATQSTIGVLPTGDDVISACTQVIAPGRQTWSCDIDPSFFLRQVSSGDTYVFRARLVDSDGQYSDFSVDQTLVRVDMTPPRIVLDQKLPKDKISGKIYNPPAEDSASGAGTAITVLWPDRTVTEIVADNSGNWSVDIPEGMPSGEAKVAADDAAGNQTGWLSVMLNVPENHQALPFTGGRRWCAMILAGVFLVAYILACFCRSRRYNRKVRT